MQRRFSADSPSDVVFAYLADFTTTEQWDAGTVATVRICGDGGVGTRYDNTSRFVGKTTHLAYVVTDFQPNRSIRLRGENDSVIAHDTITVEDREHGCLVTYRVEFAFRGWLFWLEPLLRLAVANLLDKGERGIRRELAAIDAKRRLD